MAYCLLLVFVDELQRNGEFFIGVRRLLSAMLGRGTFFHDRESAGLAHSPVHADQDKEDSDVSLVGEPEPPDRFVTAKNFSCI